MRKTILQIAAGAAVAAGLSLAAMPAAVNAQTDKVLARKGVIVLYNGQKFTGDYIELSKLRTQMELEYPIGSIAVFPGEAWEICEGPRFKEPCRVVTANETGLGAIVVGSLRKAKQPAPAPAAQ